MKVLPTRKKWSRKKPLLIPQKEGGGGQVPDDRRRGGERGGEPERFAGGCPTNNAQGKKDTFLFPHRRGKRKKMCVFRGAKRGKERRKGILVRGGKKNRAGEKRCPGGRKNDAISWGKKKEKGKISV